MDFESTNFELLEDSQIQTENQNESIQMETNYSICAEPVHHSAKPIDNVNDDFDFEILKAKIEKNYKQIAISRKMRKYYRRRYQLFTRFDDGILLDNESWFSVTPEKVALHIAEKCFKDLGSNPNLTVLDAFCGSGGNTIAFAHYFNNVISCDIDFNKIQCAQHNATQVYKCGHKINFLIQDFFSLDKILNCKIDLIFLSPPWGGVSYLEMKQVDISEFPLDGFQIYLYCLNKLNCENIVYFLPRNSNLEQILYMAGPGGVVQVEQNFLGPKLVALTAYYGDTLNSQTCLE